MEAIMLRDRDLKRIPEDLKRRPKDMFRYGEMAAGFIFDLAVKAKAEVLVETRIYLDFIHPEMFGTFDGAVVDHFGTLHVFDYKYGQGHSVSPTKNLQMIFYGIGLAHKFQWNFKRVRLWIIQPRIKGYDGPVFWEIPTLELRSYVPKFEAAVARVEANPKEYIEGSWCHWCKAKGVCPLKTEGRMIKAIEIFGVNTKGVTNGKKESEEKSGQKGREESKAERRLKEEKRRLAKKGWLTPEGKEEIGDFY